MSNLETEPAELVSADGPGTGIQVVEPREVPLGGPRAMTVRRTLPQRGRSLIGAWCFVDHYGPDEVVETGGMTVPPHPHTGLQTVSWLFDGEVEHRDSSGGHAMVRPGEVNLMTAGRGIQHSEVSTQATTRLHGAQLWVALPDRDRHTAPFFEHAEPAPITVGATTLRVFVGALAGSPASPVRTFSALVGAQLDLPTGASVDLPVDPRFEHGLLVDAGTAHLDGVEILTAHLGYAAPGRSSVRIAAGDSPLRALLLGGEPLGEPIVMWWNFIARDHDEIVALREQWQSEVIARGDATGRFGTIPGWDRALPAPVMPDVRLRPRD
ncbi:MAG: pirin family protein [Microbacteriaceae bacterium]|nr:pirin family protein [Microbacteriaceae bacterium]